MTDIPNLASSIPSRLNVAADTSSGELVLRVGSLPETCRLGSFRASVLSYVIDAVAGIAVDGDLEHWTFTSDMAVRMRPVPAPAWVEGRATILRQGNRSSTCEVRLVDERSDLIAYGALGFSRVPRRPTDPPKHFFDEELGPQLWSVATPVDLPLPEAAGIRIVDGPGGVVEVDLVPELLNPAGALQGAMVALVAEVASEEAASHRRGEPALVCELDIRYLHQARVGPIRTTCDWLGDGYDAPMRVGLVDVSTDQLVTVVTARAV